MPRWLKKTLFTSLFLVVACGGNGSGCSGCSSLTPLPQGFPADQRTENAASVRLTQSGLAFLSANIGKLASTLAPTLVVNGVIAQSIGPTTTNVAVIGDIDICKGAPPMDPVVCALAVDINKSTLNLSTAAPHELTVTGTLKVKVPDVTLEGKFLFIPFKDHISVGQNVDCNKPAQTDFTDVPVTVKIPLITDTDMKHGPRYGLTRIGKVALDLNINQNDIHICGDNLAGQLVGAIAGLVKPLLVSQLTGPIQSQVDNALCIKGNPMASPPCPVGSSPENAKDPGAGKCLFDDDKSCVGSSLGIEGKIDLGSLVASLSPTTTGAIDLQLALGGPDANPDATGNTLGDLNPVNMGGTLSMVGGAIADPPSPCVTQAALTIPKNIPTPTELMGNTVTGWPMGTPGPHLGIALNERFTNYLMGGIYNSGLLCIQITTDQQPVLTAGKISLIAPSMKLLQMQKQDQQLGIVLRPTKPPVVKFGNGTSTKTDPTLDVTLNALDVDFYVFSTDRFIRAFTLTSDLHVPVVLDVTDMGLVPHIDTIEFNNGVVSNAPLLKEDPKALGMGLATTLSGIIGQQLGPSLSKPVDISGLLKSTGLTLQIPPSVMGAGSPGLRKLTSKSGSDNYLGIFAALGIATPMPANAPKAKTSIEIVDTLVVPEGVRVASMKADNAPAVVVRASSSLSTGSASVEYAYRVDKGFWHPWGPSSMIEVKDDILRFQGHHTVTVKSRIVGQPSTEDETPMTAPILIDVDPPLVAASIDNGHVVVTAFDVASAKDRLVGRVAIDGKEFGAWKPLEEIERLSITQLGAVAHVDVEVRDERGHVSKVTQELRGKVDTTGLPAKSGCGCSVPGSDSGSLPLGGVVIAGVLGWLRISRRRRTRSREAAAGLAVMAITSTWAGCNCGSSDQTDTTPPPSGMGGMGGAAGMGGSGGSGGMPDPTCAHDDPNCTVLAPGLVGAYTSVAVTTDGSTAWVAGYNEADYDGSGSYGDLVVGKYDSAKSQVAWTTVDGTDPAEMPDPTLVDMSGWRGGKQKPGDDVGQWTSIQLIADKPAVAYFDVTHGALKFASFDGSKWASHQVDQKMKGIIGKYAKMVVIGGKPVVAYLSLEPAMDGGVTSKVRVARASKAVPTAAGDWMFEDVFSGPAPCRASFCATGAKCNALTGKCETPLTTCSPKCSGSDECFKGAMGAACSASNGVAKVDSYADATGLYISAGVTSKGDIGIVYYDRLRGNLWKAEKTGTSFKNELVDGMIPGTAGMEPDTGDTGIGTSLFIDKAGDWHISYVDGLKETVKYLKLTGGAAPTSFPPAAKIVDDGKPAAGAMTAGDGNHVVGDDSNLFVDAMGTVHISYMDATAGHLRVATLASGGTAFTVKEVKLDAKFAGYFSQQFSLAGKLTVAHWWRVGGKATSGDVAFSTPLFTGAPMGAIAAPFGKHAVRSPYEVIRRPRGSGVAQLGHPFCFNAATTAVAGPCTFSRSCATIARSSSLVIDPWSNRDRMYPST